MAGLALTELVTDRLHLEPLTVDHAREMVAVLGDQRLYLFTGGGPPALADLERRYTAQVAGSGDQDEQWLNWIVRLDSTHQAVGFVQATVEPHGTEVAWTTGIMWQRNGYANEATSAMATWLKASGASPLVAWIHPDHVASHSIATMLGLIRTSEIDEDGEQAWR
jgi:RimJ/RimL family protein N-acetyltransferase